MNKNNNRANFYIFNHSNKAEHRATKFPPKMLNTVNPVYNEHPRNPKIVAVVDKWSLPIGHLRF